MSNCSSSSTTVRKHSWKWNILVSQYVSLSPVFLVSQYVSISTVFFDTPAPEDCCTYQISHVQLLFREDLTARIFLATPATALISNCSSSSTPAKIKLMVCFTWAHCKLESTAKSNTQRKGGKSVDDMHHKCPQHCRGKLKRLLCCYEMCKITAIIWGFQFSLLLHLKQESNNTQKPPIHFFFLR